MYSIGALCRTCGLSRSTLLYYDSIGLLKASSRTEGNYRQYTKEDRERLERICAFREAGVPLNQIKEILDKENTDESSILEQRFQELDVEIKYLRIQQRFIVEMLKENRQPDGQMKMDGQTFLSIMESAGFSDQMIDSFHRQFEKKSPDFHQLFLEFLGKSEEEINKIREYLKTQD